METTDDLENRILADIENTGFITELHVGSILRKNGWSTRHSETYQDLDAEKSREIDIVATKVRFDKRTNFHLELSLVIDVKKMKKRPWVIFTVNHDEYSSPGGWRILHNGINLMSEEDGLKSGFFPSYELDATNFRQNLSQYGIAFHEAFKAPNEPSKAFEAVIGVSKAAWYENSKYVLNGHLDNFNPNNSTELYIHIPVVVLDGELFSVSLKSDGEIDLKREKIIQVQLNYSSPKYKERDMTFLPDIVAYSNLQDYLAQNEVWLDAMFASFKTRLAEAKNKK